MAGSLQEIIDRIAGRRQALVFGRWNPSVDGQETLQDIVDALETIDAELKRLGGGVGGASKPNLRGGGPSGGTAPPQKTSDAR